MEVQQQVDIVQNDEGGSTFNDSTSSSSVAQSNVSNPNIPLKRGRTKKGKGKQNNLSVSSESWPLKMPKTKPDPGAHGRWTNQMQYIKTSILGAASKHPAYKLFKDPVNPWKLNIPNYYDFIHEPMDITSIRQRLNNRYYQNADGCLKDIQLMFCNCYIYNLPDTQVVKLARELELFIIRKLVDMPEVEEDYVRGQAGDGQDNSINEAVNNVGEIQSFDITDPTTTPSPSGSGRQSLRLRAVMTKTKGPGGKVLRPPEKDVNTPEASDSEESNKSPSSGEESSDDDDGTVESESEEEDDSSFEVLNLLNKMEDRKKKHMQLLMRQLEVADQHMKFLVEAEKDDAKVLKRLRELTQGKNKKTLKQNLKTKKQATKRTTPSNKKGSTAIPKKRTHQSSCNSDATDKKPKTKKAKVSTPPKSNRRSACKPISATTSKGKGQPRKRTFSDDDGDDELQILNVKKKIKGLTDAELKTLNEQVNELDDEVLDKVIEISNKYISSGHAKEADGEEVCYLDLSALPASYQLQIKELVENSLKLRNTTASTTSPLSDPQEMLNEQEDVEKGEISTITFHAAHSPSAVSSQQQEEPQADSPPPASLSDKEGQSPSQGGNQSPSKGENQSPSHEESQSPSHGASKSLSHKESQSSSGEEVCNGEPEKPAIVAPAPVLNGDDQSIENIEDALDYEYEDDEILDIY